MSDRHFYDNLPIFRGTLPELYRREENFRSVPASWQLVFVDIEESTAAVDRGLHYEVNLAATGSIAVVQKILKRLKRRFDVPYFFGGDGATFLLPIQVHRDALRELERYRHHVKQSSGLVLRVGSVSVAEIYRRSYTVRLAKLHMSPHLTLPVVLGTGIKRAEGHLKRVFTDDVPDLPLRPPVDLMGMECRWEEILPPESERQVVCLLANCHDEQRQRMVYQQISSKLTELFGPYAQRQPVATPKLRLTTSLRVLRREVRAKLINVSPFQLLRDWIVTLIGPLYFRFSAEGRAYLDAIPELSHTLMLDGTFNTVFSGTPDCIREFIDFMDELERAEPVRYGVHVTHGSIMCCYVEDRQTRHHHFVDGTDGGYTAAARRFKEKAI